MFDLLKCTFMDCFETENKLPKNFIALPTFSADTFLVFLRAENFTQGM